jgi:hypothetical protein
MHCRLQQLRYYNCYTQEITDLERAKTLHSKESANLGIALLLQANVTVSHLEELGSKVNYCTFRELVDDSVTGQDETLS